MTAAGDCVCGRRQVVPQGLSYQLEEFTTETVRPRSAHDQFVSVAVTELVYDWLRRPGTNFGLVVRTRDRHGAGRGSVFSAGAGRSSVFSADAAAADQRLTDVEVRPPSDVTARGVVLISQNGRETDVTGRGVVLTSQDGEGD